MTSVTTKIQELGKNKLTFFKSIDKLRAFLNEFVMQKDGHMIRSTTIIKDKKKVNTFEIIVSVSWDTEDEKSVFQRFGLIPQPSEYGKDSH